MVLDHFTHLQFTQGWRLWLDTLHRQIRGVNIEDVINEPPIAIKAWAGLLLIMWLFVTLAILTGMCLKDALQHDLSADGRFQEIYVLPTLLRNIWSAIWTAILFFRHRVR